MNNSKVWLNPATEQALKQSTSEGLNAESGTREDSLDQVGLSQMSDFAAKKSVIEYFSKTVSGKNPGMIQKNKTNSIFESRDIDDIDLAN